MGSALSICEDAQHREPADYTFKPYEWEGEDDKVESSSSSTAKATKGAKGAKESGAQSMIGPASGAKAQKKAPKEAFKEVPPGTTDGLGGTAPDPACVSGVPIVAQPLGAQGKAAGPGDSPPAALAAAPDADGLPAQKAAASAEGASAKGAAKPAAPTAAALPVPAASAPVPAEVGNLPAANGPGEDPAPVGKAGATRAASKAASKAAPKVAATGGGASSSSASADPGPQLAGASNENHLAEEPHSPSSLHAPLPSHEVSRERKTLFKAIAEENYSMRRNFGKVPRTAYVTAEQCDTAATELRSQKKTLFSFSNWTTADAMLYFGKDARNKVVGLSFGNGHQVGGGYKTGSIAQEEDLCRRLPTLYTSLYQSKQHENTYPFGPCTCSSSSEPNRYSDVLFTPGVVVARAGEDVRFELLPRSQQVTVGVVTACAPDVNRKKELFDPELVYRTVKSIFLAPLMCQRDTSTLILGAWGCGAFGGDPTVISELFVKALKTDQLGSYYREVHFAIPGNQADHNARTFRNALRQAKLNVKEYS